MQTDLTSEQVESGERLLAALGDAGYDVASAPWADVAGGGWTLFVASDEGADPQTATAFRAVLARLQAHEPAWVLHESDVVFVSPDHALARHAREEAARHAPDPEPAVANPTPDRGMTRIRGGTFGEYEILRASVYPGRRSDPPPSEPTSRFRPS